MEKEFKETVNVITKEIYVLRIEWIMHGPMCLVLGLLWNVDLQDQEHQEKYLSGYLCGGI